MDMKTELELIINRIDEIGRCVYYAKSFNPSRDINAQLNRILELIKVSNPRQVGLSESIIRKMESNESRFYPGS